MNYIEIYKNTEKHVKKLFKDHKDEQLAYHNLGHTEYVVKRATEIAAHYQLSDKDTMVLYVAAWFHDAGYLFTHADAHEEKGVELMKDFIKEYAVEEEIVQEIESCIMATRSPRSPSTLVEEILADADTYNLGTKDFKTTNKEVYEEFQNKMPGFSKKAFYIKALGMFEDHDYYTTYCRDLLSKRKAKNLKRIRKKIGKMEIENIDENAGPLTIDEKQGTTKGMQTMLRLTSANHIRLSEMADSKANILISVNAIIISVILSVLLRKLQSDPYLTIPTLVFLISSVSTIVIAIMATRPKVNHGTFNEDDVRNKKTNLLFFGNFHSMKFDEYERAMKVMMQDADYLYGSMLADIYNLGVVLGRKYKLIRLAYTLFMIGIICSVLAFAIASVINGQAPLTVDEAKSSGSPF